LHFKKLVEGRSPEKMLPLALRKIVKSIARGKQIKEKLNLK
jgi:hypothetical protein